MSRPSRRAGLLAANAVVAGYLLAAAVEAVIDAPRGLPTWLAWHLLLLGAATNAIVVWTAHFVTTLLRQPALRPALGAARLVALNAGIVLVLVAMVEAGKDFVLAGAALVAIVLALHLAWLIRAVSAGRSRRFAPTVRFYWLATAAAVCAVAAGSTLIAASVSDADLWMRIFLVHLHLGLLGWVTLAVVGTQFTLWPTALRTRLVAGTEAAARRSLVLTTAGLAVIVGALLAGARWPVAVGLLIYLAALLDFLRPFVRTALQRTPRGPATWMLAGSTAWLVAGVAVDVAAFTRRGDWVVVAARSSAIVPWFVAGVVVQVLLGALSYLVPVVLGGSPAANKRSSATVSAWGVPRVVALNVGVILVAVGAAAVARAGWVLIAVSVTSFLGLAALATFRSRWPSTAPTA